MPQVHTPAQTSQSTPKVSPSLLNRPAHSPQTDLLPTNLASEEPTPREFVAVAPAPHRSPHLLLPHPLPPPLNVPLPAPPNAEPPRENPTPPSS